jgi:hypothetical protein
MSITFGNLKTQVSSVIRDPSNKTFTGAIVGDMVQQGLAAIGRYAPEEYQEDLTPVANQLAYTLRSASFAAAVPEIELTRVEIWDGSLTPEKRLMVLTPGAQEPTTDTQSGWSVWNGTLLLPTWIVTYRLTGNEATYLIRTWGYSPYAPPSGDSDVINISNELQWAIMDFVRVEALSRLVSDRSLFTQWQTRTGNTDMSPAALMNDLNMARDQWRKTAHEIMRLRGH